MPRSKRTSVLPRKGKLIVLDGNDGSGKQTQSEMLRSHLISLGIRVLLVSFPRYNETFFGRMLRRLLDDKKVDFANVDPWLASLPYAADRWISRRLIVDFLNSGGWVICDRYVSANQIHQGGKFENESEREDFLAALDQLEFREFRVPRPDISIYLDVPVRISLVLMQKKKRDTVENDRKYLRNSYKSAQWLIKHSSDKWLHVRCANARGKMRTREDIHEEILSRLKKTAVVTRSPRKR